LAGVFAWFGAMFGAFAVIALDVQKSLGFGPGGFGALLAAGFASSAVAQLAGGALVERRGEAGALRRSVLFFAGALVASSIAPGTVPLAIAVLATLAGAGALNAILNACATNAVQGDTRGFVRFHAAYSAGAFAGAVITAAIEGGGASWRFVWLTLAVVGALLALASIDLDSRSSSVAMRSSQSIRSVSELLRTREIRRLAILLFLAVAAASAVDTWGVRFLRVEEGASVVGGAGAYAVAQLIAVGARLRLVPRSNVHRAEPVVMASMLLAAGLVLQCATSVVWLGGAGLTMAAVAGALVVPLILARSGIGPRPAAAIAAVGAVGQLGFVMGPALVGTMTAIAGSAAGLLVVAALAIVTAAGARVFLVVDAPAVVGDSEAAMTWRVEET
jgi:predicted MFS family arabinose efflux permease